MESPEGDNEAKMALRELVELMQDSKYNQHYSDWRPDPEPMSKEWCVEVRDWGNWFTPPDVDDEDYDWQELDPECISQLRAMVSKVEQLHAGRVKMRISVGEKNWITLFAKLAA